MPTLPNLLASQHESSEMTLTEISLPSLMVPSNPSPGDILERGRGSGRESERQIKSG